MNDTLYQMALAAFGLAQEDVPPTFPKDTDMVRMEFTCQDGITKKKTAVIDLTKDSCEHTRKAVRDLTRKEPRKRMIIIIPDDDVIEISSSEEK